MTYRRLVAGISGALFAAIHALGCAGSGPGGFISDDPRSGAGALYGGGTDTTADGGGQGGSSSGGSGGGTTGEDPARLIAEADIVQIDGGRLYALSEYSGLSIIDVSVPDRLALLGRRALPGTPFEMYLRDGVIYAMFSGWGRYVGSGAAMEWVETSHLEALQVTDPEHILTRGAFDMPGSLADSRMVGDIVYVVTYEDGYCWECSADPNTTVTAIAVGDPEHITLADKLTFTDASDPYWGGWRRSISVTADRMYVAGIDWDDGIGGTSTVQVVDISDPDGALVLGTTVEVPGQIQSRWQIDELDGVLRVIAQPWGTGNYPRVETFTVNSSFDITPLGETTIVTPVPESLRTVRFDGTRGYAITAVQMDPLFTIDLSDPANPQVMGELEMPGWVYHIEPRGERLLALGYDNANPDGALHVSLFDVSDLTQPALLRRVAFGADWGDFAEDQDRIHKAFKILPDLGLLLVPYSSQSWDGWGCSGYDSGVQLVDWTGDDLVRRGVASVRGEARRAFVYGDRLFAMSDEQVRTFDIANRDLPEKTAELMLSTQVDQTLVHGDLVVRLAADWWTSEPRLEIASAADPAAASPLGSVDLGAMLADAEQDQSCYGWGSWQVRLFADGDNVFLVWPSWYGNEARVAVVDISDPENPRLGGHMDLPVDAYSYAGYYWSYSDMLVSAGEPIVQLGSRLALLSVDVPTSEWGYPLYDATWGTSHAASLRIVELSDADAPRQAGYVELPAGGGHTGLVVQGSQLMLSHWEPVDYEPSKVRFFLDRVDLSNPDAPRLLGPINVPGSLVSFDAPSGNLLTVDYEREIEPALTWQECSDRFAGLGSWSADDVDYWNHWDDALGSCTLLHRRLRLTHVDAENEEASLLDEASLPDGTWFGDLHVGDDRVFTTTDSWSYWDYGYDYEHDLWIIGGLRAGELAVRTESITHGDWVSPVAAQGQRLVAVAWPSSIVTVDASDLDHVVVTHGEARSSSYLEHVELDGDRALLSLGKQGLEVVDLP